MKVKDMMHKGVECVSPDTATINGLDPRQVWGFPSSRRSPSCRCGARERPGGAESLGNRTSGRHLQASTPSRARRG